MQVRLNLATKPAELNRRFVAGALVLGLVSLVALGLLSYNSYRLWRADRDLRNEITRYESDLRRLSAERRSLEEFFSHPSSRVHRERSAFLNTLITQRSFPWTKIFMDLEKTLPYGVRVINIQPTMQQGRIEVKLTVGANSDGNKLEFLKALDASRQFSGIQVVKETRPTRQGESDVVVLELVTYYATT